MNMEKGAINEVIDRITASTEFKRLSNFIENNICHDNEDIKTHTLHVVDRIRELLSLSFIKDKKTKKLAEKYFEQKIGRFKLADLLIVSAYLHDIGKPDTLVTDDEGKTTAKGHEQHGIEISTEILKALNFSPVEQDYILDVLKLHSGYSLWFLSYLMKLDDVTLTEGLTNSMYVPEILMYMIADNESASTFQDYKEFIFNTFLQLKIIYSEKKQYHSTETLDSLVDIVRIHIRKTSKPWQLPFRIMHLSEEVGELNDIYMQYIGAKDRVQDINDMRIALNDILFDLIALYDAFSMDIREAIKKELEDSHEFSKGIQRS